MAREASSKKAKVACPIPSIEISPGVIMPCLGFGVGTRGGYACAGPRCFEAILDYEGATHDNPTVAAVSMALVGGLRLIDEAEVYKNQVFTGLALKAWMADSGYSRSDVFVTGKVLPSIDGCAGWCDGIEASCRKSLKDLGITYFDLYLVHSPFVRRCLSDVWKDMEALVDAGLVRCIGVSNFRIQDLNEVCQAARIKPCVNQIECHPHLQRCALVDYCESKGIAVASYGGLKPLTERELNSTTLMASVLPRIAKHHGRSVGQVLLRWNFQCAPLERRAIVTTTTSKLRLEEYVGVFDGNWELTQEDMADINAAGREHFHRGFFRAQLGEND